MNTKTIIAAVALALSSAASFASNNAWHVPQADESSSTLTRDEARAELARATAAGEIINRGALGVTVKGAGTPASPGLTRAQVKAELEAAQKAGELPVSFAAKSSRELFPGLYPVAQPIGVAHSGNAVNMN
jgi:hypothetical protein